LNIREFIRNTLSHRAEKAGSLVVYDPERRYRSIVQSMADEHCIVVDVSDAFIQAHEKAIEHWSGMGKSQKAPRRLMVYVPIEAPVTPEQRCHDPFSGIAAGSDWFPRSDDDSYQSLCEKAKPDHRDKIRELFANGVPDLATIDAVEGGNNWPQLKTMLGAETAAEIVVALLTPEYQPKLKADSSWLTEAGELLGSQFGFSAKNATRKWESTIDELWRFMLFSEFAFDLPGGLPEPLATIPRSKPGSEILVNRICEVLRQERYHASYIARADRIAAELSLEERMRGIEDLGERDTFAFEERSFLRQYVQSLLARDLGHASEIAVRRRDSVWVRHTDRGMLWTVAERARELLVSADDIERDLGNYSRTPDELISFYTSRGYRLDQAQRELEKAIADAYGEIEGLEELIDLAGTRFLAVSETQQRRFIDGITKVGWPTAGRLRATQIFDKAVAPILETRGVKVALFFVDSLRFELAVALERQLSGSYTCRLDTACAQLPTITSVGMAALLPKADGTLQLRSHGTELIPTLSEKPIRNPQERFAYVQEFYGDRVRMIDLDALASLNSSGKKKNQLPAGVDLLLVKTTDIDEQGEIDAANVCMLLPHILGKLITGVGKLKKLGFHHAIFATDHGFALLPQLGPGDTVAKPSGNWLQLKDRCMLGFGSGTADTISFSKDQVGIQGDIANFVVPRSFGTFNKRHPYFHGGLSLPEAVLPVLSVNLGNNTAEPQPSMDVQLRYRGETSGTITTRRPVLDISVFGGELFVGEVAFRLEAKAKTTAGEVVVGEAASCAFADPATGVVRVKTGQAVKVPLRIAEDFNGLMEVRAIDAETGVTYGAPLKLKTETLT
jgi:PglZ domain-containing protein